MPSEEEAGAALDVPEKIALTATGPHALLRDVRTLELETDYEAEEWSLRMPYDNFVLTLARDANGEGALFEQHVGAGRVLLCAGGSLFTNRALGNADNAQLFANIVSARVASDGVVLFDDLRQGLSANYDPARFYRDPRLFKTMFIVLGLWLVWVLGSTRLRAPRHRGARSFRGRAGAPRGRVDRAHRRATSHGACAVRSLLRRRRACRAPRGRRQFRARRAVAMARAARRHPAAGARPAEILVRGCTCGAQDSRWYRCRTYSTTWKNG